MAGQQHNANVPYNRCYGMLLVSRALCQRARTTTPLLRNVLFHVIDTRKFSFKKEHPNNQCRSERTVRRWFQLTQDKEKTIIVSVPSNFGLYLLIKRNKMYVS